MASKKYVVTAPAVAVTVSGRLRYLYRGDPLPAGVAVEHVKSLVEMKMLGEATDTDDTEEDGAEVVVPDGEPADKKEWTIAALQKYAADHEISVGEAKSRPDLLALLVKKAA